MGGARNHPHVFQELLAELGGRIFTGRTHLGKLLRGQLFNSARRPRTALQLSIAPSDVRCLKGQRL